MIKLKYLTTSLLLMGIIFIVSSCGTGSIEEIGNKDYVIVMKEVVARKFNDQDTQSSSDHNILSNILFEETTLRHSLLGFNYFAYVNGNQYFFTDANEEVNLAFINTNEGLICEISNLIDLGRPPVQFFLTDDRADFSVASGSPANKSQVKVCKYSIKVFELEKPIANKPPMKATFEMSAMRLVIDVA